MLLPLQLVVFIRISSCFDTWFMFLYVSPVIHWLLFVKEKPHLFILKYTLSHIHTLSLSHTHTHTKPTNIYCYCCCGCAYMCIWSLLISAILCDRQVTQLRNILHRFSHSPLPPPSSPCQMVQSKDRKMRQWKAEQMEGGGRREERQGGSTVGSREKDQMKVELSMEGLIKEEQAAHQKTCHKTGLHGPFTSLPFQLPPPCLSG